MMSKKGSCRPIDTIDSRHMMSTILYIHENGPCRKMDIYGNVSRNSSMPSKFLQMVEHGILEERNTSDGSMFYLTESGEAIAGYLKNIDGLIEWE